MHPHLKSSVHRDVVPDVVQVDHRREETENASLKFMVLPAFGFKSYEKFSRIPVFNSIQYQCTFRELNRALSSDFIFTSFSLCETGT